MIWVLDGDIEKFFDTIDHDLLLSYITEQISDTRVLKLIEELLKTGVFENMTISEEYIGISQGSVISPLLANIYLHQFDLEITKKGYHLIRYADDFIILEQTQEMIARALSDITTILQTLKLKLNEKKTRLIHAENGFVFLGYYIDINGKGPSKKAIGAITRKLDEITGSGKRRSIDDRITDLKQSIKSWTNYFHTCRGIDPKNEVMLIALIEMSLELGDDEYAVKLIGKRKDFDIDQSDIWYRLGHLAKILGQKEEALNAFSQALSISPDHFQAKDSLKQLELMDEDVYSSIERLKRLIHHCPDLPQPYRDLAFCYSELGEYGQAQESFQQASKLEMKEEPEEKPQEKPITPPSIEPEQLIFSDEDASLFCSIFRGRKESFACQWVDEIGRRGFSTISRPLNPDEIKRHFNGIDTLGLYLMNEEDRVYLSVIDVDINQKALLEYATNEEEITKLHQLTDNDTARIVSICDDLKIPVLIEDSGYKGRHLWFFFSTPIPAKLARIFLKFIIEKAGKASSGIHREIFPDRDKVKGEGFGPLIKLPLGIHKRTNRRCLFLDREGNPVSNQMEVLSQISQITQQTVEEILLTYGVTSRTASIKEEEKESPLIDSLLSGCGVISYLVKKARDSHYLDNSERVTLLYTLGHLGQEGKDYLHKVISNCINYDYDYTEKKIRKIKPYPISCARIKEKHEDIALRVGCNCRLKIPYKGYPSPVLHAFKQGKKSWIPQSSDTKKIIAQQNETTSDNLNEALKGYIELKKHLSGIEKSINRIEEDMSSYFDRQGTDELYTQYGMLTRKRKPGDKYEWVIKL